MMASCATYHLVFILFFTPFTTLTNGNEFIWRYMERQCLKNTPAKVYFGHSLLECQDTCLNEVDFLCASIEHNEGSGECRLRMDSSVTTLLEDPCSRSGWQLHEVVEEPVWMMQPAACMHGEVSRILFNLTAEDCKESCNLEYDFRCVSFTYSQNLSVCYLSRYDNRTRLVQQNCGNDVYYERVPNAEPVVRQVEEVWVNETAIESIQNIITRDCIQACIANSSCHAVDYQRSTRTCKLLPKSGTFIANRDYTHYVLQTRLPWRYYSEVCIPGGSDSIVQNLTPSGCMEACETAGGFNCRAAESHINGTCYLHSAWSGTRGLSVPCNNARGVEYFEVYEHC